MQTRVCQFNAWGQVLVVRVFASLPAAGQYIDMNQGLGLWAEPDTLTTQRTTLSGAWDDREAIAMKEYRQCEANGG